MIGLPLFLLFLAGPSPSGPLIYLGRNGKLDLYVQMLEIPQGEGDFDVKLKFLSFLSSSGTGNVKQSVTRETNQKSSDWYSGSILGVSSLSSGRVGVALRTSTFDVGDSLGHGFFAIGDFIGGQKIPQVFVSVTSGRVLTCLLKYNGRAVYQMLRIGSGRVSTWPVETFQGRYVIKGLYYRVRSLPAERQIAQGKIKPYVLFTITGDEIMKWWRVHKTPYDPIY